MLNETLHRLTSDGLISDIEAASITDFEAKKPFSLHWELQTALYLGVLLLNIGLGILIYENIDTIGHAVLITVIGLASASCFWYAWKHRQPFIMGQTKSPTPYFDYILMLGCFTFLIMEGYWQFQYQIFGQRYGLATFIPMVIFFGTAYYFDNRGVLTLAITLLASWLGVTVTPRDLLQNNDFDSPTLIHTGILLGAVLSFCAIISLKKNWKPHFSGTYFNFSLHIFGVASLFGLFSLDATLIYFPILILGMAFFAWYARKSSSFYFLTAAVIYAYIGLTYCIFKWVDNFDPYLALLYFVISGVAVIIFLLQNKNQK